MTTMTDDDKAAFVAQALPPVRDPKTGFFLKGNTLGRKGRPPGYDFRAIVEDYITANGGHVEDAIVDVFRSLLAAARLGDTQAAKLLLERLCGKDAEQIDLNVLTSKLSDVERAARLQAILTQAAKRIP